MSGPRGALISQRGYEVKRATAGTVWVRTPLMCGAGPNPVTATGAHSWGFLGETLLFFGLSVYLGACDMTLGERTQARKLRPRGGGKWGFTRIYLSKKKEAHVR